MELSLAGLWQLSPLTDLSIPQDDITFPAALSSVLPEHLSEASIIEQEWHLMHDIDVDELMLSYPCVDLIFSGIHYHAEIRVNGVAVYDCDGTQSLYRKDIRPYLQPGRNRFEILFLHEDDEWLIEQGDQEVCQLGLIETVVHDTRLGIWQAPSLQFIRHTRLEHLTTEQIWHHGGGCEFLVELHYKTYTPGLVSAMIKFNGMAYQLPIDVRAHSVSALFQIEAPIYADIAHPSIDDLYSLEITLDGQSRLFHIALSQSLCVSHYPL